ncbi:MAG: calcium/sodium antiporter [Gemmatimonadota bacterium]
MLVHFIVFALSLTAVTVGADRFVTGASRVAKRRGVSPLVVGLTIVAFGTSAPELVVSGLAAWRDKADLAVGNVMGSTVANVGLIVGLGAVLRPIRVHRRLLVRESPLLVFVLAIVMVLSVNGALGRLDGLALVTGFAIYLIYLLRWGRAERDAARRQREEAGVPSENPAETARKPWVDWLRLVVGLALLLAGANWLVKAAEPIARAFHVSEGVIGATLVALGTSLPELASTVAAAARGLGDIAVGNVIGSNVFNLGLVLGTAALVRPLELAPFAVVGQVVPALIFSIALIPFAYTGGRVDRLEGLLLLIGYSGFIAWVLR